MHLELCADGLDADCDPVSNTDVTVPAFHLLSDENWIIPDRAKLSDNGATLTWSNLATGSYTTGEVEHNTPMDIEGARWNDDDVGWRVRVRAYRETELTVKIGANDAQRGTGSLVVTLYDCPAGIDPAVDSAACSLGETSWNVLVENPGQSTTDTWSLESDAADIGGSQYHFESLPAESLVYWPNGDRQDGSRTTLLGEILPSMAARGLWISRKAAKLPPRSTASALATLQSRKPRWRTIRVHPDPWLSPRSIAHMERISPSMPAPTKPRPSRGTCTCRTMQPARAGNS